MKPPRIEAVEVTSPTRLRIAWTTGERLEVDLAEPINRLKALAPLRDLTKNQQPGTLPGCLFS
jgi:hypothetical protein